MSKHIILLGETLRPYLSWKAALCSRLQLLIDIATMFCVCEEITILLRRTLGNSYEMCPINHHYYYRSYCDRAVGAWVSGNLLLKEQRYPIPQTDRLHNCAIS